ncbi:MAG: hypothetical protein DRP61_02045 [Candidatus Omnitrophota bacterium]|nr:MAG: hypothetical protein DRP61_02045 [Candidatus Omnitrophota bacterium]
MRGKQKLLVISIITGIGALLFYLGFILPLSNKLTELNSKITNDEKLIKKLKEELKEREKLEEEFSSLSKKIKARLPFQREESQFLSEIEKVAKETNIHINLLSPLPAQNIGEFKELSVEIDMEANLGNLVRFLYEIRKSSVVLVVNKLELTPKSERSSLLKGKLIISTIFLKER